ncbi:MAG TPA: replication-associated recombination protein A [Chthoniobacteraceae bacterium]|nr:replication-associated recombination protein A [Chthoniobacteraceae bacterium]
MPDLFQPLRDQRRAAALPLAARMRPRTLEEFAGQSHILGRGKLLRRMIEADRLTSLIFYGPPGTGKTTLAHLIANHTHAHFVELNAAATGVKEVRDVLAAAKSRLENSDPESPGRGRTVLFLDEIHRFNKSQQDILLGDVELGHIILIGATTENPFFSVNSALVSRSQIFQFEPLTEGEIRSIILAAVSDKERGYGNVPLELAPEAIEHWVRVSDGDARRALTALEIAVLSGGKREGNAGGKIVVDLDVAQESIQRKDVVYDAAGDEHYDAASAFIKSMRGSDPDAAIYWLARMLHAGEDPRFIARRIAILASEDIGNADPAAIILAAAAHQIVEFIGMPEAQITLAQAVTYMACCPKSNASYMAISEAMEDVEKQRTVPVPRHLRDTHYRGSEQLGHTGYQYAHDHPEGYVPQDYLGVEKTYYRPTDRGKEAVFQQYLAKLKAIRDAQTPGGESSTS